MHDLDINFVGAKPIEQSICSHHALQCSIEKEDMQLVRNSSGTHKKKKGIVVVNPQVSIASM